MFTCVCGKTIAPHELVTEKGRGWVVVSVHRAHDRTARTTNTGACSLACELKTYEALASAAVERAEEEKRAREQARQREEEAKRAAEEAKPPKPGAWLNPEEPILSGEPALEQDAKRLQQWKAQEEAADAKKRAAGAKKNK